MKLTKENFMLFNDNWALVTAGSLTHYNTMTISWGSLGCIWNGEDSARPIVSVYVKPCRYTHDFIEKNEITDSNYLNKSNDVLIKEVTQDTEITSSEIIIEREENKND